MADSAIADFTDGATANATDRIAAARSPFGAGDDRYITPAYIKTYLEGLARTFSANGAVSAPALTGTGTWYSGGTATTTKPFWLIEPAGTTSTGWSTAGTGLGVNAATGFTGHLLDLQLNGTAQLLVRSNGTMRNGAINTAVLYGFTDSSSAISDSSAQRNISVEGNYGIKFRTGYSLGWTSGDAAGSADLVLTRDAANTLALRNSTAAQTFNVYNTYTDAFNYERLVITGVSGSRFQIWAESAGTGVSRPIQFAATNFIFSTVAGSVRWQIDTSGHFIAGTDNTYDIGASGATRPRDLYLGRNLTIAGTISAVSTVGAIQSGTYVEGAATQYIGIQSRAVISSPSNGVLTIGAYNFPITSFDRLQFGGTTSSFPALARDSEGMKVICADGTTGTFISGIEQTAPAAPSANGYRIFAQDNGAGKTQLMVIFGSGAAQQIAIEP